MEVLMSTADPLSIANAVITVVLTTTINKAHESFAKAIRSSVETGRQASGRVGRPYWISSYKQR